MSGLVTASVNDHHEQAGLVGGGDPRGVDRPVPDTQSRRPQARGQRLWPRAATA